MKRTTTLLVAAGLGLVIIAPIYYKAVDPEDRPLNESARTEAPGSFVRLSDGMTHYRIDGPDTGRVVVLAHGFSVPLYIWDSTAFALAGAGYRVIRYDTFGRGYSDRPDVVYDDKLFERQLRDLLDSLRITGKIDLGGVSFGGYTAGVYAGRHPDRIRSLILVDPVAGTSAATMRPYDLPVIGSYLFQVREVPKMAPGQASDFVEPSRFPEWADRYRVQMRFKGFGRALLSTRLARRGLNMDTVYQRVAAGGFPVLLIWGVKDATVPFERNESVRKAIPNVEFHPIEGAAHLPIMEKASETNAIILQFLKKGSE